MKDLRTGSIIRSALKKVIYPRHLWKVIQLERGKKRRERTYDDPQLKLYSEILPGDFLHYGYFDDLKIQPQDISLNAIYLAQLRYAELILEKIEDRDSPVLDVGCGMGGLVKLMLDKGFNPVALSPDKTQVSYVKTRYAQVPVVESKFEDIHLEAHMNRYGTIITSESLQYLNLDASLPLLEKLLRPAGRWIVCDYFRVGPARERSGHQWDDFEKRVLSSGWRFVHQQDITSNVLPTISYAYMWGKNFARPVLNFALEKLQTKYPGAHYVLAEAIDRINGKLDSNLEVVNPETFAANKRYMLLVMEKTPTN
jgi:cyclopropane fatty-acyl-phospholipid synthase-like methyltransferase